MADTEDEGGKGSATSIESEDSLWTFDKEDELILELYPINKNCSLMIKKNQAVCGQGSLSAFKIMMGLATKNRLVCGGFRGESVAPQIACELVFEHSLNFNSNNSFSF